jgi:hypothetical protein
MPFATDTCRHCRLGIAKGRGGVWAATDCEPYPAGCVRSETGHHPVSIAPGRPEVLATRRQLRRWRRALAWHYLADRILRRATRPGRYIALARGVADAERDVIAAEGAIPWWLR